MINFSLIQQQQAVIDAQTKCKAANALERHISLQVKHDLRQLLISPKGLGASFILGAVTGATSSGTPSILKFVPIVARAVLA